MRLFMELWIELSSYILLIKNDRNIYKFKLFVRLIQLD